MKLTIGMIVKNEERYLRRCLEAIGPVLRQVDSELIIADTGSTDSTVEIAREFTDNVFYFEWCNDFSAARNAVMKRAKGEWFMTLDADEILEDAGELVSFFSSGEYKDFNSATYIQRNSNDKDHKVYSDFQVFRMTKISHETRYINAIHERIEPFLQPTKHLNAVVRHYGYVKEENLDFIEQKCKRNQDLVLAELQKDPTNSKLLYDLAETYSLSGNKEKAFEYYSSALKYAMESESIMRYPLFLNIAVYYYTIKDYAAALRTINEYFESETKPNVFDLEMHCLSGYVYFDLEKYDDSINSLKKYLEIYKDYKQGKYQGSELYLYESQNANLSAYINAIITLAKCYVYLNDYESAYGIITSVPKADLYHDHNNIGPILQFELSMMKKQRDFSRLPELMEFLNDDNLEFLQNTIEEELHQDFYHKSVLTACSSSNESEYLKLLKLRYSYFYGDGITQEEIDDFVIMAENWSPFYADILYWAIRYDCNIKQICEKFDIFDLEYYLRNKYLHFKDLSKCVIQHLRKNNPDDSFGALWRSILCFLILPAEDLDDDEIITIFYSYSKSAHFYVNAAYKEAILSEERLYLIPEPIRVGYYFYMAQQAENSSQKADFIRSAVKLYPQIADAVKIILSEIQRVINENANNKAEFDQYALIIKGNIYSLLNNNRLEEAVKLMDSYEQLCPNDQDIAEMKKTIGKK